MNYSYNFQDKKKIKKKRILFLILFLLVILIIASFSFKSSSNKFINNLSNIVIAPFKQIYNVCDNISDSFNKHFANVNKLNGENENLKQQVVDLQARNLESQKILDENNSLKEMLKINTQFQHFDLKYAKVIARQHDNWNQTFVIDLGSKDGIKLNQAVVHESGLVGYISKVNDSTSTVTTILDPIVSVSVNISTVNEPAMLEGDLELKSNNQLKLTYIPIGVEVSNGDVLYTSGLSSYYPSGIPVAKVTEVVNKKNDTDRYAITQACVNIRSISEVGIIIN